MRGAYAPVTLTAKERPNLIHPNETLDTIAAPMALIALDAGPGSPRAALDGYVVSAMFEKYAAFTSPNDAADWREVNLAASVNWPRLAAAQDYVESHRASADASLDAFHALAKSAAATEGGPSAADADKLYQSLMQWRGAGP